MGSQTIVRTAGFDFDLKRDEADKGLAVLSGRMAVFNDWTEIKSQMERPSHFMERIAPGAFTKTIRENGDRLKVLFQHGMDPSIGKKPLGRILRLEEQAGGVEYEVELLDAPYVRDLLPGLEAQLYGSSFLASDVKSTEESKPKRSDHNPQRLPEITRTEMRLHEFGPVTFPAYAEATARMRSETDQFVLPGLRELVQLLRDTDLEGIKALTTEDEPEPDSPDGDEDGESTPEPEVSRSQAHDNQETKPSWFLE